MKNNLQNRKDIPMVDDCQKQLAAGQFRPSRKYCNNNCNCTECVRYKP